MGRTTFHMCINVEGLLRTLMRKRSKMATGITDDNGRPMTREDAISRLFDELRAGHSVLPFGPGCDGFDYGGKGCPGHPVSGDDTTTTEGAA